MTSTICWALRQVLHYNFTKKYPYHFSSNAFSGSRLGCCLKFQIPFRLLVSRLSESCGYNNPWHKLKNKSKTICFILKDNVWLMREFFFKLVRLELVCLWPKFFDVLYTMWKKNIFLSAFQSTTEWYDADNRTFAKYDLFLICLLKVILTCMLRITFCSLCNSSFSLSWMFMYFWVGLP